MVLDVDPRTFGDETLERLISRYGELPETAHCATGGGGWHYYFQYPGRIPLIGKDKRYRGLDIKGDGGYVVAPPSVHHSGGTYQWLNDWCTMPLAPVPDWLLHLIMKQNQVTGQSKKAAAAKASLPGWMQSEISPADWEIISRLQLGWEGNNYLLLSEGNWEGLYPTHSEADLAMFNKLARLTRGDPGRMYTIFKETGLMRSSNDKHPSYYERTIRMAIDGMSWRPAGSKETT